MNPSATIPMPPASIAESMSGPLPAETKSRKYRINSGYGPATVPHTETVYRAVVRHLARRAEEAATAREWNDSGYLFVSPTGAPLHESNITKVFHSICDRAEIPRLRFHDTRHTCGTLLHVQGADPFIIQKVLGHSQLSTTRRYTHVPVEVTGAALDGLEALLSRSKEKRPTDAATVKTTVKAEPRVA